MRRTIPAAMAAILALSATPVLAQDAEEASAEPTDATYELTEVPTAGLSLAFPDTWGTMLPEGTRVSAITTPEGEPIFETTAVLANGGGAWCDVDVYFDMTATLEEHAYGYTKYLQEISSADAQMIVVETKLPAGPSYRIEIFDPARERLLAMYLVDGPLTDDGTFDRYLLTCAAAGDSEPFWEAIAESMQLSAPVTEEEAG